MLSQCWINDGPPSTTLGQCWSNIGCTLVFTGMLRMLSCRDRILIQVTINRRPTIYRNLYENTGPGQNYSLSTLVHGWADRWRSHLTWPSQVTSTQVPGWTRSQIPGVHILHVSRMRAWERGSGLFGIWSRGLCLFSSGRDNHKVMLIGWMLGWVACSMVGCFAVFSTSS